MRPVGSSSARLRGPLVLGIAFGFLFAGPLAGAIGVEWKRSCRQVVSVEDEVDPEGRVYERAGSADMILSTGKDDWFLVRIMARKFHRLDPGTIEVLDETRIQPVDLPLTGGEDIVFEASAGSAALGDSSLRVLQMPDLLGETTAEAFLSRCPEFQARRDAYRPEPGALETLARCEREVTLEVYFGSWCPHCQKVLPQLFKCLLAAENQRLEVRLYGLPRGFSEDPVVQEKRIRKVPTVVVLDGDRELGRFHGNEAQPIESMLAELIGTHPPAEAAGN